MYFFSALLEPLPSVLTGSHRDKHPVTLTFTPADDLNTPVDLKYMFLTFLIV